MNVEIPQDFVPITQEDIEKELNQETVRYWIYPEGNKKPLEKASGEETFKFCQSLFPKLSGKMFGELELTVEKTMLFELCMIANTLQWRSLLGGPEFWESLPDWQRPSKLFGNGKDSKKYDKE